jgi:ubiquinone/menaquinone biosynthesis C-methylase UbiE
MNEWKQIWERKGMDKTTDLDLMDGLHLVTKVNSEELANQIIKKIQPKPNERILDVGCGAGATAKYIAPLCKYVGIDYSEPLVKKHIQILNNSVLVAEANDIPFKDKYFDKSFAFSCFQYFPNKSYTQQVLNEMKRVTKKLIFIGDITSKEEGKNHLLYQKEDFPYYGKFSEGFHNKKRFNVVIKLD